MAKRPEKKSESLEIRLPYSQKKAFVKACREKGMSASEALRSQIDAFMLEEAPSQKTNFLGASLNMLERHKKKLIAATGGTISALTLAFAMPSVADGEMFKSYDRNGDGVLTAGEISANDSKVLAILDKDKSGTITPDEFKETAEVTEVKDTVIPGDPQKRIVEIENTRFHLDGSDEVQIYVQNWAQEVDLNASQTEINNIVEGMKQHLGKVQEFHEIDDVDPEERARVMAEISEDEEFHTMIRIKTLEGVEAAMQEVEKELASLDIHLNDLGELKDLKKLADLKELEHLADLQELEQLKDMEFDFDFEFDHSDVIAELNDELAKLKLEEAKAETEIERQAIEAARAAIESARDSLSSRKHVKHVFVMHTGDDKDITISSHAEHDGEPLKIIKKKIVIDADEDDTSDDGS